MEDYKKLAEEASLLMKGADHLIYVTYPVVKDPKMLMGIMKNIYNSSLKAIDALLAYERSYKRIPIYTEDFYGNLELVKTYCLAKYSLPREFIQIMKDIKEILEEHQKSPVEFRRNDNFIICSDNYRLKSIDVNKVKAYLAGTKPFVEKTARLIK